MQEFKSFLACLILMGLVGKTQINEYWEIDKLTHTPSFHHIMSRNRFKQILEFLHFSKALPSKKNQSYLFPAIGGFRIWNNRNDKTDSKEPSRKCEKNENE